MNRSMLFATGLCLGLFLAGTPGRAQTSAPSAELSIEQAVQLARAYLNEVNPEKQQALLAQAGDQSVCDPAPFLQLLFPAVTNAERAGVRQDVVVPLPGASAVRSAVCSISVPAGYTPTKSYPLVIGLHGGGQDMGSGREYMGSCRELVSSDVVFVCPTSADLGVQLYWRNPLNEVLLMGLIKSLGARYNIDRNRVYLVGYSMGGIGCYYLAPRMSEWFAGVAPGGGAWMGLHWPSLLNTAIYIWHGRFDNRGQQYTNYSGATNAAAYLGSLGTNQPHWTLRTMETPHATIPPGEERLMLRWLLQYPRDPYPKRIVMASPQVLDFTSLALPAPPDRWLVIDQTGEQLLDRHQSAARHRPECAEFSRAALSEVRGFHETVAHLR
jgi:predicted esterase